MFEQTAKQPIDPEFIGLAAKLTGFQTLDLLHVVQRPDGSLVVILASGQKYVFDPQQIAAAAVANVEAQVEQTQHLIGGAGVTNPKPPKPKKT